MRLNLLVKFQNNKTLNLKMIIRGGFTMLKSKEVDVNKIKNLRHPYEFFKGQKIILTLMDGTEYKGVFLEYRKYEIEIATNIGTEENNEKGELVVHKTDISNIIENNKGFRREKKKK